MPKKKEKPPCMYPGCNSKSNTRGLCTRHYNHVNCKIDDGDFTEDEAIDQGFILPADTRRLNITEQTWLANARKENEELKADLESLKGAINFLNAFIRNPQMTEIAQNLGVLPPGRDMGSLKRHEMGPVLEQMCQVSKTCTPQTCPSEPKPAPSPEAAPATNSSERDSDGVLPKQPAAEPEDPEEDDYKEPVFVDGWDQVHGEIALLLRGGISDGCRYRFVPGTGHIHVHPTTTCTFDDREAEVEFLKAMQATEAYGFVERVSIVRDSTGDDWKPTTAQAEG